MSTRSLANFRSGLRALLFSTPMLAGAIAACSESEAVDTRTTGPTRAVVVQPAAHRQYGRPQKIGNGTVRAYVILDEKNARIPLEVGVAISKAAMDGLPAPVAVNGDHAHKGGHNHMNTWLLDLPAQNPTSYKFVRFDWNPGGHEPPGVYDIPHFDFHFYKIPVSVMNSIVDTDPQFASKAASLPAAELVAPFFVDGGTAAGAPQAAVVVPQMGLHWLDVRSPELQKMAGNPEGYRPFTKTFLIGSWDGEFIFDEPMITRAYLMAKSDPTSDAVRDEIIALPAAQHYAPAGFYPSAYRITYDAQAREYRVALTELTWRN